MTMHKKKILNSNPLLFLSMLCIVIIIFLTDSVNVKASNNYTYPFNIADYNSINCLSVDHSSDVVQDFLNAAYLYDNNEADVNINFSDCLIYVTGYSSSSNYCTVSLRLLSSFNVTSFTPDSSCVANTLKINLPSSGTALNGYVRLYNDGTYTSTIQGYNNANQKYTLFGSVSTDINQYWGAFTPYYPVFISSPLVVNGDTAIYFDNGFTPTDEEFQELQDFLDITSTISTGIDNSVSDLQNMGGFFNTLISNLKNFFNALKGWLSNGFGTLMGNIKLFFGPILNGISSFIGEFFDSFEDFKDKFSHFFQIVASIYNLGLKNGEFDLPTLVVGLIVPDVDQLSSIISSSVLGAIVFSLSTFSANTVNFVQSWFNTTPVYIYHIPDFTFHGQTISGLYFDFSWYSTYKPYGDAIISFWLVINYGMFLLRFVPRFLRSAGSGYSEGSDIIDYYDHPDRDDGAYYFENGMRAPSMFDFM